MSFREKSAWVTLVALLVVSAMYAFHVPGIVEPRPGHGLLMSMVVSVAAFIVIELIAYVVLAIRNPRDARTPRDERERLIEVQASRMAYYVYVAGSFLAIFLTVHIVHANAAGVGTAVALAFVVAEIVKYATRIVLYRRDT